MTAAMWAAVKIHSVDPLKTCITLGADLSLTDERLGNTALHYACAHSNHTAFVTLLAAGAPLRTTNRQGDTPAAKTNHE